MGAGDIPLIVASLAFLTTAIGWLIRELWLQREHKRQAAHDAGTILKERKAHLEDMIAKTEDVNSKQTLIAQLDEVNAALIGFYPKRLRRTLEEAGLPPEEMLIADGRRILQAEEARQLAPVLAEVNALRPFLSTKDLFVLGYTYYHMQQYQDAKNIYDQILDSNPDNAVALTNRGATYDKLERYDDALAAFDRSLELSPDDPGTLTNRGATYDDLKRYDEALADYNRSLELRPDDPATLTNRGNTYQHLERYDEAIADYNRSLELRPDDPNTLMNRGVTYCGLERYDDALADFNRSLELRPDHRGTLTNRGITYGKLERYDESLADFNRSLELKPDDENTLYNLACLFSLWRKTGDSVAYLKKAIALDKKYLEKAKTDKDFDNIRDAPRFKELMELD